jgi:hypothetical protein
VSLPGSSFQTHWSAVPNGPTPPMVPSRERGGVEGEDPEVVVPVLFCPFVSHTKQPNNSGQFSGAVSANRGWGVAVVPPGPQKKRLSVCLKQ